MNKKKLLCLLAAAAVSVGVLPTQGIPARAAPADETGRIEEPYSEALTSLLRDKQQVTEDREKADQAYKENMDSAEESVKDMEKVRKHLDDQQKKYPDYDRIVGRKERADKAVDEARTLLMEASGSSSTGEYKYGIEVAPDAYAQQKSNDRFAEITTLSEETEEQDITVDRFRGFYDIPDIRKAIVKKALSEKGKISYRWGGKSLSEKTPDSLDCSGFVRWVYHYATGDGYDRMMSTASVGANYSEISHDELKPGDVGMKNREGTGYISADGNFFSTEQAARSDNKDHNSRIQKKISKAKADMKDDIRDIRRGEKEALKEYREKEDSEKKAAEKSAEVLVNEGIIISEAPDTENPEKEDTVPDDEIRKIKDGADEKIKKEKKKTEKTVKNLREKLVDVKDVRRQTGHIGIYAGRNKDGKDTWVHCTGGSKDTVVVTTEEEYDGFRYFYAPLNGLKPEETENIRSSGTSGKTDYEVTVPDDLDYSGAKTYERYTAIKAKTSPQYKLQQTAYTDPAGFRMVQGRYLIAVGTGVTSKVGQYLDVVLGNGTIIPCIVGDIKADIHTEKKYHIMTRASHDVSEFIVDGDIFRETINGGGDVSAYTDSWNSPVRKFIVYKDSVF